MYAVNVAFLAKQFQWSVDRQVLYESSTVLLLIFVLIFNFLSRSGSWGQQSYQGSPDILLPDPNPCPGSAPGS